ncbi:MAG: hypothetical protein ACR2HR_12715 [Euzebya sp.]
MPTDDSATVKSSGPDPESLSSSLSSKLRIPVRAPVDDDGVAVVIPRSATTLIWQARVGVGLGILGLALAALFFFQARGARNDAAQLQEAEATRQEVQQVANEVALQVTTFTGATIDQWVTDTMAMATGDYATQVATLFDSEIRQGLAANDVTSSGAITSSFVQDVSGDDATVFAVLRQTYNSINQQRDISDDLRMEIRLRRQDGRWLASEVAVLGPSQVTPLTEGAQDVPALPGAQGEGQQ